MEKKNSYCLKRGEKSKNEDLKGVKLKNKVGQKNSTCVVSDSKTQLFKNR